MLDRRRRQLYATVEGERLALRLAQVQTRRFAGALEALGDDGRRWAAAFLNAMIDPDTRASAPIPARRGRPAHGRSEATLTSAALEDDAAHVLVVDDDRRLRALLSSYLMKNGHRVTVAATAAEARTFLDGLAFDMIVLDVMMPGETGFEFAADLRKRSQAPILMLTARGEPQDRVLGILEIGVDDYLSKPFEPRELLLRIGSVLRRTRASPFGKPEAASCDLPVRVFSRARRTARRRGGRADH